MAISHRTNRLKLLSQPSVEQLQNGRFRLTLQCRPLNPRNDWYEDNKDHIFLTYGSLYSDTGSPIIDGVNNRQGETYPNMRLTSTRSQGSGDEYIIELVYETLSSTFVQTKDDTIDYELNGLRRVTRESIAEAGTDFQKTVGTTTISSQIDTETAVTCVLASYQVDDTDSYRKVTETYIEAGTISRTEDLVGSQDSLVLETIGADPDTPSGFSLASKQESNFQGYQTNRFTFLKNDVQLSASEDEVGSQNAITEQWFKPSGARATKSNYSLARKEESDVEGIPTERYTFLKDNVVLSESEDKVGSQLSITKEVFNGTPSTPSGYALASEQESNVDGIPTRRYTFLKNNTVLSVTQDKVGSQKAIVNEVFNPTTYDFGGVDEDDVALTGYVEASRQVSDFEGIKTVRYTFLEPSILSVSKDLDSGQDRIVVRAFDKTSSAVKAEISDITINHLLVEEEESDFEGIKTSNYVFEKQVFDVIDYELNGLKRVTRTEISTFNFSELTIGSESQDFSGLYVASQRIDNGGDIKRSVTVVIEPGTISEQIANGPVGLPNTVVKTVTSFITEPTSSGVTLNKSTTNSSGFEQYEYRFLEKADGSSPVDTTENPVTLVSYEKNIQVRQAGVVSASEPNVTGGTIAVLSVVPPSIKNEKADVTIKLTTDSTVATPVAYNLSNTSCSASITNTSITPVGVEEGDSLTVSVFNSRTNSRTQSFPNHYKTGSDVNASYTTAAQIIKDDDNVIGEALNQKLDMDITLTGSSSEPATTGVYQEDVDPVFFDADGTQYFRKTRYNIPTPPDP